MSNVAAFLRVGLFVVALLVSGFGVFSVNRAQASDSLDIQEELSRPGVKLVVVEFYATWCKPCMEAVPQWKALHEKYRRAGLRFIVVSADDGVCTKPPDWSPDATLCDADGALQKQMGVTNLPMSFLYSWEGNLALKSPHVEPVDRAIQGYFRDTHYKIDVEPVEVIGDKYALSGNPQRVREEVVSQLRRKSKVDVVSERHTPSPRKDADVCVTEFPANSTLRIKALGYDTGERMLALELEQDGCVRAQATHPYTGQGFQEDWSSLQRAIDRATTALLGQLVRVRAAELVGGSSGGDWFSSEELFVLRFESDPVGATVLVDNEPVCDATPCSRSFPKGTRTVSMLRTDYITRNENVTVLRDMTLNWTLTPNFGWLTLAEAPEGLEVRIDGQVAGKTPLTRHRLSPGRHVVEIASPCYEPLRVEQSITRDRESRLSAKLTAREGGIDVSAQDEQGNVLRADIFVDGVRVGAAPGRFRVNVCAKELVVKSQGRRDFSQRLSLKEREIVSVKAVLGGGQQPVAEQTTTSGDVWFDSQSGLTWQNPPADNMMRWQEAKDYCSNLTLGGRSDWRLPSISELRSLIRGCPAVETGGSCGVTDSCLSYSSCRDSSCAGCSEKRGPAYGCYWPSSLSGSCGWYWSSSPVDDRVDDAWSVYFDYGAILNLHASNRRHVQCVR